MTRVYIATRSWREAGAAGRFSRIEEGKVKVVYVTGFPRNGTTLLKYYFSGFNGLKQTAFTPVGFFDAWNQAAHSDEILVDKSNHYIYSLKPLFTCCRRDVRVVVIIRDPRDSLVSLASYKENREVPRDQRYWNSWDKQHRDLLDYLENGAFNDCLFVLRYEDLVRFPEQAKATFLNWLGIEASGADLDRTYRNEHPDEGWHDSVHDHREVGTHALQKWRKEKNVPVWCRVRLQQLDNHEDVRKTMAVCGYTDDGFSELPPMSGPAKWFCPSSEGLV